MTKLRFQKFWRRISVRLGFLPMTEEDYDPLPPEIEQAGMRAQMQILKNLEREDLEEFARLLLVGSKFDANAFAYKALKRKSAA